MFASYPSTPAHFMETQLPPRSTEPLIRLLTERHKQEWLELLAHLRQTQAPAEEIARCQYQLSRLQGELQQLRSL